MELNWVLSVFYLWTETPDKVFVCGYIGVFFISCSFLLLRLLPLFDADLRWPSTLYKRSRTWAILRNEFIGFSLAGLAIVGNKTGPPSDPLPLVFGEAICHLSSTVGKMIYHKNCLLIKGGRGFEDLNSLLRYLIFMRLWSPLLMKINFLTSDRDNLLRVTQSFGRLVMYSKPWDRFYVRSISLISWTGELKHH